jgi:hypothetical protein
MDINSQLESKMATKIQKSSDLGEIWFPSRLWCCELISIIGLIWWPFWFWIQNAAKSDKISGMLHPILSTIANQRWISIRKIIIYLETKFRSNRRNFVFGGHFVPWVPWQRPPFWICSTTPKSCHILWLDEAFRKFCLTCVHIILRLRNFRMAAIATKNVKNLKCSELDET